MGYGTGGSNPAALNVLTDFGNALGSAVSNAGQGIATSVTDIKDRKAEIYSFKQTPDTSTLDSYTTIGPGANELSSLYKTPDGRGGAHHFRMYNLISPDVMLVHQSKMVGFYLKTGSRDKLNSVPREIKRLLLRDNNIPLHRLRTLTSEGVLALDVPWVDKALNLQDNPATALSLEQKAKNMLGGFFSI
jgi:hypothetical protein